MISKARTFDIGIGTFAMLAVMLMIATTGAQAQLSDLAAKPEEAAFDAPGFLDFCVGDPCPGQTCDEVNDQCVGSVTLQPAMGDPLVGLSAAQLNRFNLGKAAFGKTFTVGEGLGPVFNQDSCASCHSQPVGGSGTITVTRFGEITVVGTDLIFDPLEQFGGSLLNKESISPECAEVIPVPPTNVASQRLTNSTLGFGLVEAISGADIEFNELNPPAGVSGRTTVVPKLEEPGTELIGRFGWKSQLATVTSFTADAMLQEMGITSRVFPEDNPPNNDLVRLAACDTVADPEDVADANGNEFLDLTSDFQRFLAAPPQTPRSGMAGEALFDAVGCADCHMTGFAAEGDDETEDAIAGKTIDAYSDFLLHDMGGNGDFIEQGSAGLTEIRTTPLWGLRVRDPLWHDGRVAGGTFDFRMFNAVLLHDAFGSEAQPSAQTYLALPMVEQLKIVSFLESLGRREFDLDGDGLVDDGDLLLFDDCLLQGGPFTPDDLCAIADADQNGFVDAGDEELLNVVLGVVGGDDEDEDEDGDGGDDEISDSEFVRADADGNAARDGESDGGMQDLQADPPASSSTANSTSDDVEGERERKSRARRLMSRRGQ